MKWLKFAAITLLSVNVWAQSEISLSPFTSIELEAPVKLKLVGGELPKAKRNAGLASYSFKVNGAVLEIGLKEGESNNEEPILICFQELQGVKVNGVGAIEMEEGSKISSNTFTLLCNGASKTALTLDVKDLKVTASGATKLTLNGNADKVSLDLQGASKYYGAGLIAKQAMVKSSGASYFNVNASDNLAIEASGASKGIYGGSPTMRNINVSGNSDIVDANTGKRLADERENPGDTTRIKFGKKKVIIIDGDDEITIEENEDDEEDDIFANGSGKLKNVYAGFELGMGALTTNTLNFQMPADYKFMESNLGKSWFYGVNLLEGDMPIIKNKLAITSGLGMEFQNIEFNSDRILIPNVSILAADSGDKNLTRNRMYCYNINVPLLIKFAPRTKKSKDGFHAAVGVIGTFKAYNHLRIESSENGYKEEAKLKDDFNVNPFRVSVTARIGYGWFRAFANYSLTPFFNTANNNPDLRSFSAGITLIPFDY